ILASECRSKLKKYKAETGKAANLLFLQNHGIFFAADSEKELDLLVSYVIETIKAQENNSYTSDKGKTYDFNTADKLNALLIKALVSTGELYTKGTVLLVCLICYL
ncbi:MAG: hypothetical protein SPE54_04360, partial [Sodaliphilus sp.]|nr:hypothetical protein [Sodaliphilus sp.]